MSNFILPFYMFSVLQISKIICDQQKNNCYPGCVNCNIPDNFPRYGEISCSACESGYRLYLNKCYRIIEHCSKSLGKLCTSCYDGYYLNENGVCVKNSCEPSEFLGGFPYCNNCTIGLDRKCLACVYPYELSDGHCVLKAKGFTAVHIVFLFVFIIAAIVIAVLLKEELSK